MGMQVRKYITCEECGQRIRGFASDGYRAVKIKSLLEAYGIPMVCRLCFEKKYKVVEREDEDKEEDS